MAQKSEAIPTPRVYALLKAANPGAEKGEKDDQGRGVNENSRRTFKATLAAARQAKSPKEFAELLGGEAIQVSAGSCGAITELTVEYPGDGTVRIRVAWENCPGHTTIYAGGDL